MGKQTSALLAALNTACASVDELGQASADQFTENCSLGFRRIWAT